MWTVPSSWNLFVPWLPRCLMLIIPFVLLCIFLVSLLFLFLQVGIPQDSSLGLSHLSWVLKFLIFFFSQWGITYKVVDFEASLYSNSQVCISDPNFSNCRPAFVFHYLPDVSTWILNIKSNSSLLPHMPASHLWHWFPLGTQSQACLFDFGASEEVLLKQVLSVPPRQHPHIPAFHFFCQQLGTFYLHD